MEYNKETLKYLTLDPLYLEFLKGPEKRKGRISPILADTSLIEWVDNLFHVNKYSCIISIIERVAREIEKNNEM